uniref:Uncharacterized protein n=1 Tax=Graphocephala atropunctata TaxID=36148 RepID=A0A1B6MM72_9HEMI
MPYYYLLPEALDEPEELVYDHFCYKKPLAYNLLLPSIHISRDDNVLLVENDAQEAVTDLLASCRDSTSWPSSAFRSGARPSDTVYYNQEDYVAELEVNVHNCQSSQSDIWDVKPAVEDLKKPVKLPMKSPFGSYDASDPHVLDAARSLFFERKRQQAVYEAFPSWHNPSGSPRIPTDYELFVAWASLSRSEKMSYISEVNGSHDMNHLPHNTLESQRAVSALYASNVDAACWPSLQYSRALAQPTFPPPRINPQLLNHHIPHI